jgi:pimeloyl-ACP methyl ester carboxylesterase
VGELDDPCREPANFMDKHLPDSRLVVMPKTGHSVNIEKPDDFNREMLNFFEEIGARQY